MAAAALPVTTRPPFEPCAKGTLDLVGIPHVDGTQLDAERGRHGLEGAELTRSGRDGGIAKDRCARYARCDLLEKLQPLASDAIFKGSKADGVAARSRQRFHIAGAGRDG